MLISQCIVALAFFFLFIIFSWKVFCNVVSSSPTPTKLPPSPPRIPLFGNIHQLGSYPHRSLWSLSRRYGPLMLLHLGSLPVLVVSSADAARQVMRDYDLIFSSRLMPKSSMADKLLYRCKDIGFSPYGEFWRQVRSICVIQLLSNTRVQSFRCIREEETYLMVEKIRQLSSLPNLSINLTNIFVSLTNDIVCRAALGRKYGIGEGGEKFELLRDFVSLLGTFSIGDYIPWLAWVNKFNGLDAKVGQVAKHFDEFLEGVIEEHRNRNKGEKSRDSSTDENGGSDFVDILLEFQKENWTGFQLETDVIKALILDMFSGGTDTTHTAMEWTMAELLRHPKILEKLQNEVRQVAGEKPEITEADLEKLRYLRAVIKESLRLHAALPLLVPRESTKSVKLMGYDIAAGTQVLVNAWAIGRDPSFWENADEFRPERFLAKDIDFKGLNFEFIPFGAGRRGCPGMSFAIAVNELALAKLVHKFDFALPNGGKASDVDMSEASGLTVHKRFPLFAVATPRPC